MKVESKFKLELADDCQMEWKLSSDVIYSNL